MTSSILNLQNTPDDGRVTRTEVHFESHGARLAGLLFTPAGGTGPFPAAVVAGAWTTVKEQMAGTYARELAARGVVALAFDFRGWGASVGTPRYREDPVAKTEDVAAAVDFLAGRPEVDGARLGGLGICASAGYLAETAADHPAMTKLALVAPWLHDRALVEAVYGGAEGVRALRDAAKDPGVLVAASTDDETAPMFGAPYYTEAHRGLIDAYDNRFDRATWEPWLAYDAQASADRLEAPTFVVASEAMALPAGAHAYVARTAAPVTARWLEDISQFEFYDRRDVVTEAADVVAAHLGGAA